MAARDAAFVGDAASSAARAFAHASRSMLRQITATPRMDGTTTRREAREQQVGVCQPSQHDSNASRHVRRQNSYAVCPIKRGRFGKNGLCKNNNNAMSRHYTTISLTSKSSAERRVPQRTTAQHIAA
jgi:hypothetical protein